MAGCDNVLLLECNRPWLCLGNESRLACLICISPQEEQLDAWGAKRVSDVHCILIIQFMECSWLPEMSSDYNLNRCTWPLQYVYSLKLCTFSVLFNFKDFVQFFQPNLFNITDAEENYMKIYCVLRNWSHSTVVCKLVMHVKGHMLVCMVFAVTLTPCNLPC